MKNRRGDRTYSKIMEAAIHCMATDGIEATTTRSIAKKAKVSVGLVSYHCHPMSKLFENVIKYTLTQHPFKAMPMIHKTAKEKLFAIIRSNFFLAFEESHYYRCVVLSYYYSWILPEVRKAHIDNIEDFKLKVRNALEGICLEAKKAVDPKRINSFANSLAFELEGALLFSYTQTTGAQRREYEAQFMQQLEERLETLLNK